MQPYLWAEVNEDRQRQRGDERRTELKPPSDGTSLCYGSIGAESEEDTEGGLRDTAGSDQCPVGLRWEASLAHSCQPITRAPRIWCGLFSAVFNAGVNMRLYLSENIAGHTSKDGDGSTLYDAAALATHVHWDCRTYVLLTGTHPQAKN
jgi:hypothetical protein